MGADFKQNNEKKTTSQGYQKVQEKLSFSWKLNPSTFVFVVKILSLEGSRKIHNLNLGIFKC